MKDIMGMMKKVQEMQAKMAALQEELDTIEVEGGAGAGMVKVVMTAKGSLRSVSIDPSLLNADEKEILEDLVVAAVNDAKGKAEKTMQDRMSALTAGLPIPPGLKLF
jgi:DNA-binding YbaB/EbfC family protein